MTKAKSVVELVRPSIIALRPYSSARGEFAGQAQIRLDANENPFGSPLSVAGIDNLNRYPDPLQLELRRKLSAQHSISLDSVFVGNGSDEAIDLLMRVFCEPHADKILISVPSYPMYEVIADIQRVEIQKVDSDSNYDFSNESLLAAVTTETKIVFVCSPNNPTGRAVPFSQIKELAASVPGLLVVDEAYIDFCDEPSAITLLPKFENVVVLQTFSKAWGLAGARVGVAYAHPQIISFLQKIKAPYNVSALDQAAALQALTKSDFVVKSVAAIKAERARLLRELPLSTEVERVFHSDSNFLLVKFKNAKLSHTRLLSQGIVTRDRSEAAGCAGCIRITIGTEKENTALLQALGVSP